MSSGGTPPWAICGLQHARLSDKLAADKLAAMRLAVQQKRDSLVPGDFGHVSVEAVKSAMTHFLGHFSAKFHWVTEPPYKIWKASPLAFCTLPLQGLSCLL